MCAPAYHSTDATRWSKLHPGNEACSYHVEDFSIESDDTLVVGAHFPTAFGACIPRPENASIATSSHALVAPVPAQTR